MKTHALPAALLAALFAVSCVTSKGRHQARSNLPNEVPAGDSYEKLADDSLKAFALYKKARKAEKHDSTEGEIRADNTAAGLEEEEGSKQSLAAILKERAELKKLAKDSQQDEQEGSSKANNDDAYVYGAAGLIAAVAVGSGAYKAKTGGWSKTIGTDYTVMKKDFVDPDGGSKKKIYYYKEGSKNFVLRRSGGKWIPATDSSSRPILLNAETQALYIESNDGKWTLTGIENRTMLSEPGKGGYQKIYRHSSKSGTKVKTSSKLAVVAGFGAVFFAGAYAANKEFRDGKGFSLTEGKNRAINVLARDLHIIGKRWGALGE